MEAEKQSKISLTGRPPVKIRESEWPIVARSSFHDHDGGEHEFQANRHEKGWLRARVKDGRAIVFGVWCYETAFQHERDREVKAGELVAESEIVAALQRVHAEIAQRVASEFWGDLLPEAIASMPAEEL